MKLQMWMMLQKGIKPVLRLFCAQELGALSEKLKQIAARLQTKPINHHQNRLKMTFSRATS